ncbi:MAG: hypothetical protein KDD52_02675 [Bdellovibrionales bacterium]|nr:hypothetical protein [Bdellovibrionales bacterium]
MRVLASRWMRVLVGILSFFVFGSRYFIATSKKNEISVIYRVGKAVRFVEDGATLIIPWIEESISLGPRVFEGRGSSRRADVADQRDFDFSFAAGIQDPVLFAKHYRDQLEAADHIEKELAQAMSQFSVFSGQTWADPKVQQSLCLHLESSIDELGENSEWSLKQVLIQVEQENIECSLS